MSVTTSTAERAIGSRPEPLQLTRVEAGGQADAAPMAEGHGLSEDARHQEVQ